MNTCRFWVCVAFATGAAPVQATGLYSLAPGSPTLIANGWSGADLFDSAGNRASAASLGLQDDDDIDGVDTLAPDGLNNLFSVDPSSMGAVGTDVRSESAANQQAADVYVEVFGENLITDPGHTLGINQNLIAPGLAPAIPAGTPNTGSQDDIDALSYYGVADSLNHVFFSLAAGSPTLGLIGASPYDILISGIGFGTPAVVYAGADFGLQAGDDIDAFSNIPGLSTPIDGSPAPFPPDGLAFSLRAGSPTLALYGADGGDVFRWTQGGGLTFRDSSGFGGISLASGDELDALTGVVPLPAPAWMLLSGLLVLRWRARR
jgi:hypothetical protein